MLPETRIEASRPPIREILGSVKEIIVAGNRGPCGGVNMAIEATEQVLEIVAGRELVYTNWDVVNNALIMNEFKGKGLVNFGNDWSKVPDGSVVMFSAHGVPPLFRKLAKEKKCLVIDVTCPLVAKVHRKVMEAQKENKHIVYIGTENHPEPQGVIGEVDPENITFVQPTEDVRKLSLPNDKEVIVYSQTTLSTQEVADMTTALRNRLKKITIPDRSDICYAVGNRQAAVRDLITEGIDMLLIVGSKHSHNSQELKRLGEKANIFSVSIDKPDEIDPNWFSERVKRIGVSSGASVLARYLSLVLRLFEDAGAKIKILPSTEKGGMFALPKESINLLAKRYQTYLSTIETN